MIEQGSTDNTDKLSNKYVGKKYGHLTITGIDRDRMKSSSTRSTYVFADCDCGVSGKSYSLSKLKNGGTKSCGHLKYQHGRQYKQNKIIMYDTYGIIYCNNDEQFYFDVEDYKYIKDKYWYSDDHGYLTHAYTIDKKTYYERFHRIVMNVLNDKNIYVDHINKNTHDNRKQNLRLCTHQENDCNNNLYKNNTSGIIGVSYIREKNKWRASITYNRKTILLGYFENINDAIKVRVNAEKKYFKEFAPQVQLLEF